jgi:glycosyltransferase involved in cell wall biosynthesis
MRVLWICGLPREVQDSCFRGEDRGSRAAWPWIVGHLPPPNDIDLHIACLWPGGIQHERVAFKNACFHLLPCPARGRAALFFQRDTHYFRPLFETLNPDLVHGWGTEDSFGLVARRLAPQRHVIGIQGLIDAYHGYLPKSYRTSFVRITERMTLKKARNVVAESHYALDSAAPLCPLAASQVIEHPLRPEFLSALPSNALAKTVLFVGAIESRKGIIDAITTFSKTAPLDWSLHVIGRGTLENEDRMHKIVGDVELGARFRHLGSVDSAHMVEAMQDSSVFLLPSRVDTGPTALKEALTLGLWPVCYDNSGPGEYIRKYEFGSLARNYDLDSLATELAHCLVDAPWQNIKKRVTLARKTREDFSHGCAWNQLNKLYQKIIGQ